MQFDLIYSFKTLLEYGDFWDTNWTANSLYTYILVPENYDINLLKKKLPDFLNGKANDGQAFQTAGTPFTKMAGRPVSSNDKLVGYRLLLIAERFFIYYLRKYEQKGF